MNRKINPVFGSNSDFGNIIFYVIQKNSIVKFTIGLVKLC
jgi:hypothetical protein